MFSRAVFAGIRRSGVRQASSGAPQSEATFLGIKKTPGKRRKWEQWEAPYYFGMISGALICVVGLNSKPETSLKVWARDEAEARNKMVQDGEEVTFGANHSHEMHGFKWVKPGVGEKLVRVSEDNE